MNYRQEILNEVMEAIKNHKFELPLFWEPYVAANIFQAVYEDRQHWINMLENLIEINEANHG